MRKLIGLVIVLVLILALFSSPTFMANVPSDTEIGKWDPVNRIYTLNRNVNEGIVIDEDDLTLDGNGHTVLGSGSASGVYLSGKTGVIIEDLKVENFYHGIILSSSSNNTLKNNTASNNDYGIYLSSSSNNTLKNNTASNNSCGIYLLYSSSNNTLKNNTASNNSYCGILLYSSSYNTLRDNTASNNSCGIYLSSSSYNTLRDNTASKDSYCGIYLSSSSNNTLTDNTFNSNNYHGICLWSSSNNTLTGNTASNNSNGIYLSSSSNNTLTDNTFNSNNYHGILLSSSSSNQIYNNNFIDNLKQAYVYDGSGNVFNLEKPIGGNYWNDWTSPDVDYDGFVDSPYIFTGGPDNLPLACQDGWKNPVVLTQVLIGMVKELDLPTGIEQSLTAPLETAINALERGNEEAAIGKLNAFINSVESFKRAGKLTEEQADALIAAAQRIIDSIQ